MKKINFILFALALSVSAFSGTESGGGGGVIWIGQKPVLMDSFTIVKDVSEIPFKTDAVSKIPLGYEALVISAQNEKLVRETQPAFNNVFETLDRWQALPFDVMSQFVLLSMRQPLIWNFTEEPLQAPPFYLAQNLPEEKLTEVVAYYSGTKVNINRVLWNKLNLFDQEALIIHETLRQVQIGYKQDFDDQSLQRATAIYSLCKPSSRLNYYMYYLLNNSPESADKIYGPFTNFINTSCKRVK